MRGGQGVQETFAIVESSKPFRPCRRSWSKGLYAMGLEDLLESTKRSAGRKRRLLCARFVDTCSDLVRKWTRRVWGSSTQEGQDGCSFWL
jgi:hypothetical protein